MTKLIYAACILALLTSACGNEGSGEAGLIRELLDQNQALQEQLDSANAALAVCLDAEHGHGNNEHENKRRDK